MSGTGADSHRSAVPEVTFCAPCIAKPAQRRQHGYMASFLRSLLQPMMLAGLFAISAVAMMLDRASDQAKALMWSLLTLFTVLFLLVDWLEKRHPRLRDLALLVMSLLALLLIWQDPKPGVAPILLVIWVAVAAGEWPTRRVLIAALLANLAFYLIMRGHFVAPLRMVLVHMSFQLFGALCVYYAKRAEHARDALVRVNADLLATRALLADSARDGERLRLARELHDVAGHKLTALKLNMRALAADPELGQRGEVRIAQDLASELLDDIRGVVAAMREGDGLDLRTALHALAAPFPQPRLQLQIDDEVKVSDPLLAETLLRTVQEALTNSARHANAKSLQVRLSRQGDALHLRIEDDGQRRGPLREGNGLAGMRERIEVLHGRLSLSDSAQGGLRIDATLPA